MIEVFKIIPNYPDYEVSNCGRVRTLARKVRYVHAVTGKEHFRQTESKILKSYMTKHGYRFHQLRANGVVKNKTVHRLVAETFLVKGHMEDTVNHKDGNKLNNRVDNLEWCTNAYNHEHATKNGLKPSGSRIASSVLNERCVSAIRYLISRGISHTDLGKAFNVSRSTISLIYENKTWKQSSALTGTELNIEL